MQSSVFVGALAFASAAMGAAQPTYTYTNYTLATTGQMYHGGDWHPAIYPPQWAQHLFYDSGFAEEWVAGYFTQPNKNCTGICPNEYPFALTFNTSNPASTTKILASPLFTYGFSPYSVYAGCVATTPTKQDDGTYAYAPQGVPCTITVTGQKDHEPPVTQSFQYKAEVIQPTYDGDSPHKSVQQFNFTDKAWKNVTHLTFNATYKRTKEFQFAPKVYINTLTYGGDVLDTVQPYVNSGKYYNGVANFETNAHGYVVESDEPSTIYAIGSYDGHRTHDLPASQYCASYHEALCPTTPNFKLAGNSSVHGLTLEGGLEAPYFDLHAFDYGCIATGRDGKNATASCLVTVEISNSTYQSNFYNLTFHANGSKMALARNLGKEWVDNNFYTFKATVLDTKTFPWPPVVAVDTVKYGFPTG